MKRAVLLLVVAAALTAWFLWPRVVQVDVLAVTAGPATRVLAVNGTVRPRLSVDVKAPVAGTLTALPFDIGDQVTAGSELAAVDDAPQRAAIAEAEAAVASQRATLEQAGRDLTRFEALGEFATRQRREQARLAVDAGRQELRRLEASVVQAREVQERYRVRAPFAGVILERPVDPGQTIGVDTVLYRLADLGTPDVTADVDEIYAADLTPGGRAFVAMRDQAEPVEASILHVQPRVDPATGAREVRLRVAKSLNPAPAGATVTVNLIVDERDQAISIPRSAILKPDTDPHVRTIDADERVAEQPIQFIDWPAATVIVTKGLQPGMTILSDPDAASPGDAVRPR